MPATRASRQSPRKGTQPPKRGPGRPALDAVSGNQLRAVIVAASARLYAERGYHGVSVARILKAAGISRPTFYRYFADRYQVLDVVIGGVNDQLRDLVLRALTQAADLEQLFEGLVDAYFEWGERIGPLVGPLYREIHDQASPASAQRLRLLDELMAAFTAQPRKDLGITMEPLLYEAAMHVVEHLGHATFWPQRLPKAQRTKRRAVLVQALRGLLTAPGTGNAYS